MDAHTVEVNGKRISSDKIIICTGASRAWPSGKEYKGRLIAEFPRDDKRFLTADTVNGLTFLPQHLGIVGGMKSIQYKLCALCVIMRRSFTSSMSLGTGIIATEFAQIFAINFYF